MYSLIGDRFLKQFFGRRSPRRRVNPAGSPMENEEDKPTEQGYLTGEDPVEKEVALENKKTGEANNLSRPEIGSIQPASDH